MPPITDSAELYTEHSTGLTALNLNTSAPQRSAAKQPGTRWPHASPYTTLAAGHYPTLTAFAYTGDFQGILQRADSKSYTRLELHVSGELLLKQDSSLLHWNASWSHTPRKGSICYFSLLHQQWKHI